MFILDTDHATFYQQGHPELQKRLQTVSADQIVTTVVTYEEQITGRLAVLRRAQDSQKRIQAFFWLQQTLTFFCYLPVLPFDALADSHFQQLRRRKLRIGTQDQLIASIALANDATVLTRNYRDFAQIPKLKIEDWTQPTG